MPPADMEPRLSPDFDRRPAPAPAADRTAPWWIAAVVAVVAIVALAVVLLNRSQTDQQAAFNQGAAQATANTATQQAQAAAAQANASADSANAAAVNAQTQAARRGQQNEDDPAQQPQVPAGVTSASPPGVQSSAPAPQ